MKYYRVLYSEEYSNQKNVFGILDVNNIPEDLDEFEVLDGKVFNEKLFDKVVMNFEGEENSILADFQMTLFPWRLVSEKMYLILLNYKSNSMEFFPIIINFKQIKVIYYYFHFGKKFNVLDKKRTGDSLLNPVLDVNKVHLLPDIFCYKEMDPSVFCVSKKVKDQILEMKLTGLEFQYISSNQTS